MASDVMPAASRLDSAIPSNAGSNVQQKTFTALDGRHRITLDPQTDFDREIAEVNKQSRMPGLGGLMPDELESIRVFYTSRQEPSDYEQAVGDKILRNGMMEKIWRHRTFDLLGEHGQRNFSLASRVAERIKNPPTPSTAIKSDIAKSTQRSAELNAVAGPSARPLNLGHSILRRKRRASGDVEPESKSHEAKSSKPHGGQKGSRDGEQESLGDYQEGRGGSRRGRGGRGRQERGQPGAVAARTTGGIPPVILSGGGRFDISGATGNDFGPY